MLILFLAAGALIIGLSIPLIQKRIGPNPWYGFRVRQTLQDREVWYAANTYAAWRLLRVGIATIVAATALFLVPGLDLASYALLVAAVVLLGVIGSMIQSFAYLRTLAKGEDKPSNRSA